MLHVLPHQLPWWVAGPGIGLCVVAMYGLANVKLGVSGGWLQLLFALQGRRVTEPWRIWFNTGLVVGAVLAGVLGSTALHGYGALEGALPAYLLVPVLLSVGVAIGYGARWAGGCTSGHGLSGCSVGSPESLAATGTFFGVAVLVTLGLHALTGGAL
ncbi:YeeE/YedE family protein [Oryzihumus sp.]|uniref:YeeE/YedE family protein n=1 Tax=Oryzihumus sp. TaxID=1968903 RepID=UPI002ED7C733